MFNGRNNKLSVRKRRYFDLEAPENICQCYE